MLAIIKDLMLINSCLPVNFWAEAIDAVNYFHNYLSTKRDGYIIIPEEVGMNARQNLEHVRIFGSKLSTFIPMQKRSKSDIQKIWRGIFIGYTETSKHLRV